MTEAQLSRAALVCTRDVLDALMTNGARSLQVIIKSHMKRLISKGRRK